MDNTESVPLSYEDAIAMLPDKQYLNAMRWDNKRPPVPCAVSVPGLKQSLKKFASTIEHGSVYAQADGYDLVFQDEVGYVFVETKPQGD